MWQLVSNPFQCTTARLAWVWHQSKAWKDHDDVFKLLKNGCIRTHVVSKPTMRQLHSLSRAKLHVMGEICYWISQD